MISNKLHAITRFFTFHPLTLLYRSCTFVYLTHSMLFLSLFSSIHILYRRGNEFRLCWAVCDNYKIAFFVFSFFFFQFSRSTNWLLVVSVDESQWDSLFSENFGSPVVRSVDWLNRISDENQQTNLLDMPERSFGWSICFGHSN